MKITTLIIAVALTLFINQVVAQQNKGLKDFAFAWKLFAKAVINSDTLLLTKLSIDTIYCPLCSENTDTEQKIMNRIRFTTAYPDTLYNFLAKIPTIVFYRDDLYSFFNGNEFKV